MGVMTKGIYFRPRARKLQRWPEEMTQRSEGRLERGGERRRNGNSEADQFHHFVAYKALDFPHQVRSSKNRPVSRVKSSI